MSDDLHSTMDAVIWAKEFCKRWPSALCQIEGREGVQTGADFEDTMIGWFANAIMVGYDTADYRAADRIEALEQRLDATKDKAEAAILDLMSKLGKAAKAVELLKEARQDLEEYVTHEWPKDEHPVYERKWHRDMELYRRIDAVLAEIEGGKDG